MSSQSISVTKDASSCHLFVFEIIKREDILKESRTLKPMKLNRKVVYIPRKRVRTSTQLFGDLFHPDFNECVQTGSFLSCLKLYQSVFYIT